MVNIHVKCLITQEKVIYKKYLKNGRPISVYKNLQTIENYLVEAISSSKNVYFDLLANNLNDPITLSKTYCAITTPLPMVKKFHLYLNVYQYQVIAPS